MDSRYVRVRRRLSTVEKELHKTSAGDDGFDNREWLLCEREALRDELATLKTVVTPDGTVNYPTNNE